MSHLFSDLFLQPLLTGLCFAALLPVLGSYLRLRNEWLAALAYSQTGAAGALSAMALGAPILAGGLSGALLAALSKRLGGRVGEGNAYALLLLFGWGVSVLLVSNLPMAERMGHALFDGQLYFTGRSDFVLALTWSILALFALRTLSRHLLLAHLYPAFFKARSLPAWPTQLGFDLLAAGSLALSTMTLGVMATFALIFVPAWLAFEQGSNWRHHLGIAATFGLITYLLAFVLALETDQPFGPVLALVLLICSGLVRAMRGTPGKQ